MTVSVGPVKKIYQGNGLNRNWGISFPILDASHVTVWVDGEDGGSDLVDPSAYEVDMNAQKVVYPLEPEAALMNGKKLALIRKTPIAQEIDIVNHGNFFPETIEGGLDRSILIDQELREELDRSVKVPATVDNPEEYGRGVINASNEAKVDADRAASAAASAAGYAGSAKAARDRSETAANIAAEKAEEVETTADQLKSALVNKLEFSDLLSGQHIKIEKNGSDKVEISSLVTLANLGAAAVGHNHDTDYASLDHNHNGVYSSAGHNHNANYAALGHNHDGLYLAKIPITLDDVGKVITVKSDGSGFELKESAAGGLNYWESDEYPFTLDAFTIVTHGLEIRDPQKCFCAAQVKYIGPSNKITNWNQGDVAPAVLNNVGAGFPLQPTLGTDTIKIWSGRNGLHLYHPRASGYITLVSTAGSSFNTEFFRYIFRIWY